MQYLRGTWKQGQYLHCTYHIVYFVEALDLIVAHVQNFELREVVERSDFLDGIVRNPKLLERSRQRLHALQRLDVIPTQRQDFQIDWAQTPSYRYKYTKKRITGMFKRKMRNYFINIR